MPCLSSSPLLDRYIDGDLSAAEREAVEAHVDSCRECETVLTELRVVDALLLNASPAEVAPNFTFAVMAEIRSLARPIRRRTPLPQVLASYLGFAWATIAAWFAFAPASAHASMTFLRDLFVASGSAAVAISSVVADTFGHRILGLTASVYMVLTLDVFAACTAAAVYCVVRPRLGARAGSPPESR